MTGLTDRSAAWIAWSLAYALELVLCRVSDRPLALVPVLEEALWFVALGALAIELPLRLRRRAGALAGVPAVAVGALIGLVWLLALRFGLRPHGRLAELGHWAWAFAILSAYSVALVVRGRAQRLLAPLIAVQALAVALFVWIAGPGEVPWARLTVLLAIAAALIAVARNRRTRPWIAAIGAVVALCPLGGADPLEPRWTTGGPVPDGPDLVLLVADALRADAAAGMESADRLAAAGADLGPALAPAPWTLPSMASVLTGVEVAEHGAARLPGGGYAAIADDVPTLAERLAAAGYDTAALLARNPNASERYGFDRGFAVFDFEGDRLWRWSLFPVWGNRSAPVLHQLVGRTADSTAVAWAFGRRKFLRKSTGRELVSRARWVLGHRRERPLFLWLHFMDPHVPYLHLPRLELTAEEFSRLDRLRHESATGDPWFDDPHNRELVRRAYRAEVAELDAALVELLDSLGPPPPNGRVVVLTADHGEEFWEHGGFEHGHSFYQEVAVVPLVVSGLAGARSSVDSPAALIDLAPTLLAAAGLEAGDLPGTDLARGSRTRLLRVENLRYAPKGSDSDDRGWEDWFAARMGALYLHARGEQALLFDLAADPNERTDLAREQPGDVERLLADQPATRRRGKAVELTEDEREALRALGYME